MCFPPGKREAMASDVRFVKLATTSHAETLLSEGKRRDETVDKAREAASDAAAAVSEVRLTQRRLIAAHAEAREMGARAKADVADAARLFEAKESTTREALRDAREKLAAETATSARLRLFLRETRAAAVRRRSPRAA